MSTTAEASTQAPGRREAAPVSILFVISLMFLFSGASGLTYEVIWSRQLTTFFGSTIYGVATVLCSFMGGLALGSWLLGSRADRMKRPLAAYGWFEIGIGAAGLLFPFLLRAVQPIIGAFYVTGGESTFFTFSLVRFVITFALLMVPTTLMGATLPVMSKAITRDMSNIGHRIGGLYALNTAGAVLGVFATGFFLLEQLGLYGTTILAALVNFIIGGAAIYLGKTYCTVDEDLQAAPKEDVPTAPERDAVAGAPLTRIVLRFVLFSYFLSGLISLAYQVAWTRALIFGFSHLKSTTYSFSGMLVVFLLGLAVGSAIMQAIVDKQRNLLRLYAFIQLGIGLSGALSWFVMRLELPALQELQDDGTLFWGNAVFNVMFRTAAAIGLPTFLMGLAFPVVARLVVGSLQNLGIDIARVYALNTLGAILGSFLAGFVFIGLFGITYTIAMLAGLNLLLAAGLFLLNKQESDARRFGWAGFAVAAAVLIAIRLGSSDLYLHLIQPNEEMVYYEEGALATVSVVENTAGDRTIYVDAVGVAGTDKVLLTDQKSLAHVPMIFLGGEATRTLSVGFGSGGASYSYTAYDNIDEIHTIEIAPEVIRAAPSLLASNYGVILPDEMIGAATAAGAEWIQGARNPVSAYEYAPKPGFASFDERYKVLIDDARSYLRFTEKEYDVIATDCTDLRYKSNANLYDLEYFELCRKRLSDRGLVVVWMPLAGLSDLAFRSALRTFQVVFPEMSVWYFTNYPTHYCLLIGGKGSLKIDYAKALEAMAEPDVARDLEEIGLDDPEKLMSSFVCDDRSLTEILEGYPLNTENSPIIEFEAPRYGYDPRPLFENMMALYEVQNPIEPLLTNVPDDAMQRINTLIDANPVLFRGHHAYRMHDWEEALRYYMEAKEMAPFDETIDELLEFDELRRHIEGHWEAPTANTFWLSHAWGRIHILKGDYRNAATFAGHFARMLPTPAEVDADDSFSRETGTALNTLLAEAYLLSGNETRAREFFRTANQYSGNDGNWEAFKESKLATQE